MPKGIKGFQKGNKLGQRFKKGHKINLGRYYSEETKQKISKSVSRALRGHFISKKTRNKISKSMKGMGRGKIGWWKNKKRPELSGINNSHWKGGISKIHREKYWSLEYRIWRTKIFTRDKFTCVNCGKIGGRLEAHHIKSWANFPKFRFNIDNGITLCWECHNLI